MDETIVQEIKAGLMAKLKAEYGYCGVAENDKFIMLNSGEGNIIIKISWEDE